MKKITMLILTVAMIFSMHLSSRKAYSADTMQFPYDVQYPYGGFSCLADNQQSADTYIQSEWESWKRERITANGARGFRRVQRDGSSNYDTVSEGLGYGMILAVYFGEQQLFNDLYNYVKCFLNSNGLMSWHIASNGSIMGTEGVGAATDADEDIAIALVFAHKKWGSEGSIRYSTEARNYIDKIYQKMVEPGTYVLKPGDMFGGSDCTNPSYFAPAWYRVFAEFTGNGDWNKVADKCYEIAEKARNKNTGLVPDWCNANGGQATGNRGYDFKYDAIRYQWRVAIDYSWYGTAMAKTHCDKVNAFFKNIGCGNIKDGYTIAGNQISNNHTSTFVTCCAASAMTGDDSSYARDIYNENIKIKDSGNYSYFGNSLRMMILLYTTGNFPNLYSDVREETPTPSLTPMPSKKPTPSPTPTNIPVKKGDVNRDGKVDSLDYAAVKKAILAGTFSDLDIAAADMNDDGTIDVIDLAQLVKLLLK